MSDSISPTASAGSGIPTVPNTPRSDKSNTTNLVLGDQHIDARGQAAICVTPSSEDTSSAEETSPAEDTSSAEDTYRRRRYNIQPTWPSDIKRSKIKASAYWQLNQELRDIFLDIHWNRQDGCALFKLYARLCIKGVPGTPQNDLNRAFIFINPKIISKLLFEEQPIFTPFGYSTVSLTFHLCQPPDLVLPKTYTGFEHGAKESMRSLQSLAQQSCFTIYARLPSRDFSTNCWMQFCEDIATQKLEKDANVADLRNLYQGHGGQVIQDHGLLKAIIDQDDAPGLPVYQETDPSNTFTRPPKRKKSCDESSTTRQTAQSADTTATPDLLEIVNAKFAAQLQTIGSMVKCMLSEHEQKLLRLVKDETETWNANVTDIIQKEVEKEMDRVKESIMEEIALNPVQVNFTFPNHPYL